MMQRQGSFASPERGTFSKKFRSILFSNDINEPRSGAFSPEPRTQERDRQPDSESAKKYKFIFSLLQSSDRKKKPAERTTASTCVSTPSSAWQLNFGDKRDEAEIHIAPFWTPPPVSLLQHYKEVVSERGCPEMFSAPRQKAAVNVSEFVSRQRRDRIYKKLIAQLINFS